jgi:hypothetical protein
LVSRPSHAICFLARDPQGGRAAKVINNARLCGLVLDTANRDGAVFGQQITMAVESADTRGQ